LAVWECTGGSTSGNAPGGSGGSSTSANHQQAAAERPVTEVLDTAVVGIAYPAVWSRQSDRRKAALEVFRPSQVVNIRCCITEAAEALAGAHPNAEYAAQAKRDLLGRELSLPNRRRRHRAWGRRHGSPASWRDRYDRLIKSV
jgi:hypothetical protein